EPLREPFEGCALDERGDDDDEEDGVEDRVVVWHVGGEGEGGEDDRCRPAEPCPAEQRALTVCESAEGCREPDGDGSRGKDQDGREREPLERDGRKLVREDEQAEHDEQRHLRDERKAFVERDELATVARRRAAHSEPDEVDGEEAAAVESVRGTER